MITAFQAVDSGSNPGWCTIYKMKRINLLQDLGVNFFNKYLNHRFNIEYDGLENLIYFPRSNTLLLPKHQHILDILLEGMILKKAGQRGYFLMKGSLPKTLDFFGGIVIIRPKKINRYSKRGKKQIEKAKQQRDKAYQTILHYLPNYRDTIVIHPEQTRHYHEIGYIKDSLLTKLIHLQDSLICPITFVPLDIKYSSLEKGANITLSLKPAIQTNSVQELGGYLRQSIMLFE